MNTSAYVAFFFLALAALFFTLAITNRAKAQGKRTPAAKAWFRIALIFTAVATFLLLTHERLRMVAEEGGEFGLRGWLVQTGCTWPQTHRPLFTLRAFHAHHPASAAAKRRLKWATMKLMAQAITRDPEVMHGTPVFRGTRVPVQTLFEYLEGGETLEDFLAGFPAVRRELAIQALEEAKHLLLEQV